MVGKEQIIEELGEKLLPNLVDLGLAANDRAKYWLTLLQAAKQRAEQPGATFPDLRAERLACGIEDASLDLVIGQSTKELDGRVHMPQVAEIHARLMAEVEAMLAPLEAADGTPAANRDGASPVTWDTDYRRRFDMLRARAPDLSDERIARQDIDALTTAPASGDSLHLLIMHLHKELNRLQQQIALEMVDDAQGYGLMESDRPWVRAFMRGVRRTRPLKFDHPGLATTASRSQGKLVLQNDIGTTDAHVLVVHVEPPCATLTYSDIHMRRLIFFQTLFQPFPVQWEDTRSRHSTQLSENVYHLCVGQFTAADDGELSRYLEHLGANLVFLIDWNRARKRLRKLVPRRTTLELLHWAALQQIGHMGFLKVGGDRMVFDAVRLSSRGPIPLGGPLTDIIEPERAAEFLRFVLRTSTEGLLAGHSEARIRDEVRAELRHYLETAHQGLLELAADHATLIVELATTSRDCLLRPSWGNDPALVSRAALRAKAWEHRADELVVKTRAVRGERVESRATAELLRLADDAADELEEGIFLLTLLDHPVDAGPPAGLLSGDSRSVLLQLSNLVLDAARAYLIAVERARRIHRASPRDEMNDFLEAIDQAISLEHRIDDAHRGAKQTIVPVARDCKQLYLFTQIADTFESASDALMRAAIMLRDYILGEIITR